MVFYVALALAALISPTLTVQDDLADDAEALRGIEQTAPTIREPILASCMIEVAAQSGNQAQLTDEKIRGYAQKKARRLLAEISGPTLWFDNLAIHLRPLQSLKMLR